MDLKKLLNKRLIIVSGKGGVGKTSVSIILAFLSAGLGKKVLLLEMNSSGRIAPFFHVENISHRELTLTNNISLINLSPAQCFKEYAIDLLYFSVLYKSFFTNRYVSNFINAVPGLDEFMMMAKINNLESQTKLKISSKPKYDTIIVDAPATGHGLSILEVPEVIGTVIKIGPPHRQANSIVRMLNDKNKTAFCLVTLAEEMPVAESEEYIRSIRAKTKLNFGPMFINAVMPKNPDIPITQNLPEDLLTIQAYYTLAQKRAELNQEYIHIIEKRFKEFNKILIPFQFQGLNSQPDFELVAQSFKQELL